MRKLIFIVLTILISTMSCGDKKSNDNSKLLAQIETNRGFILLDLNYKLAPITVANFVSLAEGTNTSVDEEFKGEKFYDGLLFHRVVPDFVIQGGDPEGTGRGGPGYSFGDEFHDSLTHKGPGILSMANSGPETNGSQFFITLSATPHLDDRHSVFGSVIEGQNVVDSIQQNDTIISVEIIRQGSQAKRFNAGKVFDNYLSDFEIQREKKLDKARKEQEEKAKKIEEITQKRKPINAENVNYFKTLLSQLKDGPEGVRYLVTKEGSSISVKEKDTLLIDYSLYSTDGELLATSIYEVAEKNLLSEISQAPEESYQPMTVDQQMLSTGFIPGFSLGVSLLNVGDHAILLLPWELAYGEEGSPPVIPPKADLIFEVRIE